MSAPRACCAALVVALMYAPAHASAQQSDPGSLSEAQRKELGELFERAKKAWDAQNYLEAIVALEAAHAIFPEPNILHRIGEAHETMGDLASAAQFYRRYVAAAPDAKDAGLVRRRIDDLDRRIAQLEASLEADEPQRSALLLDTNPAGAVVRIDEKAITGRTPVRVELAAGLHRVELTRDGHNAVVREIRLDEGETISLVYQLERVAQEPKRRASPWPWIVGGAGVASLGASAGFLVGFRTADRRIEEWDGDRDRAHADGLAVLERPQEYDPTAKRRIVFRNAGIAAAGVGVLAVSTGVVWLITRGGKKSESQRTRWLVGPGSAGIAFDW